MFWTADGKKVFLKTSIALFWLHGAGQVEEYQLCKRRLLFFWLYSEVLGCASEGFRLSCVPGLFCRTGEEECWLIVRLFLVQTEAASVSEYLRQECVTALLLALTSSQSRWAQGKPSPHLPQPPIEVGQKWKERPNPVRFTKKQPDFTVAITSVAYSIWP